MKMSSLDVLSIHIVKPRTRTNMNVLAGMPLIFLSVTFGIYANEVLALGTRTMYRQSLCRNVMPYSFGCST
ncbi:hypothetical protein XELAEV_18029732mg [Xenopus laevis]|uniref:Uncharacterized protein n=1 Tax=Xenopus laevis TaxID=8355 RepID=A0A974HID0_XENLA|nr:hypothetical protein XELAEV_18029732mg [Xenopus laevis]